MKRSRILLFPNWAAFIFGMLIFAHFGMETKLLAEKLFVPKVPDKIEEYGPIEFYLVTAGVGDDLASRFGHTGIRVKDPYLGLDLVYNWGKFSFNTPGFGWRFFRGTLTYSMGVRTFENDVAIYREKNRFLVMEPLHLTNKQKMSLYQKIAFNAKPENRDFNYQYWFKNCSTIPRDLLDQSLGGAIYQAYAEKDSGRVFRDYVRRHLGTIPFVVPGLDIMMNGQIDRSITMWEEMFLPAMLRHHLKDISQVDDEGKIVLGTSLLGRPTVLVDGKENFSKGTIDYFLLIFPVLFALAGALILGILAKKHEMLLSLAYKWLGISAIFYGVLFGALGLVLVFNWIFSGHSDGWANKNLIFFWPIDFIFAGFGYALIKAKGPIKDRFFIPYGITLVGVFKIFFTAFYAVLLLGQFVSGEKMLFFGQDMTHPFLWFGTVTLIFVPIFLKNAMLSGPWFREFEKPKDVGLDNELVGKKPVTDSRKPRHVVVR